MSDQAMRAVGVLTARVILGLIFGMAGYWKTFELTPIGDAQAGRRVRRRPADRALFNFNGYVIPRRLMLLVVALLPRDADRYSIDYWLVRRRASAGEGKTRNSAYSGHSICVGGLP